MLKAFFVTVARCVILPSYFFHFAFMFVNDNFGKGSAIVINESPENKVIIML